MRFIEMSCYSVLGICKGMMMILLDSDHALSQEKEDWRYLVYYQR